MLLPYLMIAGLLARMLTDGSGNRTGTLLVAVAALALAVVPPFLGGTRELEIAAARLLLGADLPVHERTGPPALEARLRAALWFAVHLATGGLVAAALIIAVPLATLAFAERLGLTSGALSGLDAGPLQARDRWGWTVAGVLLLLATAYATAGLGALAAMMAPALLGPSPAERLAALRARERQLAERNRLARELHDSVGHALTAATLQAGAARAVLDRDPEFARRALGAIEELGRTALGELDAVLGLLREDPPERHGRPTLADLERLLTGDVDAEIDVLPADVPAVVSREAYRIVQECLTNAAKHGPGPATLRVSAAGDLLIEVVNAVSGSPAAPTGGRGLDGMRERVRLLGGEFTAGAKDGVWRVVTRLPARPAGRPRRKGGR